MSIFLKKCQILGYFLTDKWHFSGGSALHTARIAIQWLTDHFVENFVLQGTVNPLVLHNPELNILYFYMWGFLKDELCCHQF